MTMKLKCGILITIFLLLCIIAVLLFGYAHRKPYSFNEQEIAELTKRADGGDSVAATCLSRYYSYRRDGEKMLYWLRKSAEYNNAISKFNIYYFAKNKDCTHPKRREEALSNLEQAAAMHYHPAEEEMATLHFEGKCFAKNPKLAESWARHSVVSGQVSSMHLLSRILLDKNRNNIDLIEAYMWTDIALLRCNIQSEWAQMLRNQQAAILKKANDSGRIKADYIKKESAKLAGMKEKEVAVLAYENKWEDIREQDCRFK